MGTSSNISLIDGNSLQRKSKSDFNLSVSKANFSWKSLQMLGQRPDHSIQIEEIVPRESEFLNPDKSNDDNWQQDMTPFTSRRRGKKADDKKLSKKIRRYYKQQDLLITAFEDIKQNKFNEEDDSAQHSKRVSILAKLSFAVNLLLLASKSVAAFLSKSLSVITSVIDSMVDLVSGVLMWWSGRAIRKRDPYLYPQGRTRLEPVAIVVLSVIMSLASVAMIQKSVETIVGYVRFDLQNSTLQNESAVLCLSVQEMAELIRAGGEGPIFGLDTILICVATIVLKFILYILCRRCPAPSTAALAQDHRNDVLSNSVALACGYIAFKYWKYADPIGAILISIYIIVSWCRTGSEQIKLLTGHTARPDFFKKLTWLALNHHEKVLYVDTIRAFHFGNNFLVEVDVVLPGDMSMHEAHDIGESLQTKLEKFQEVERAFVHIDYEMEHHPTTEHKVV